MINLGLYTLIEGNPNLSPTPNDFRVQKEQWAQGKRFACLHRTQRGWAVRLTHAFDDSVKSLTLFETISKSEAIEYGVKWAKSDQGSRQFLMFTVDVDESPVLYQQ